MMTTKSFVDLPDTIFCNIIEYLDWYDVGGLDTALLNRNARIRYLDALKLRKVKVERNESWKKLVDKGILSWLISRNIRVISWNISWSNKSITNSQLLTIANGFPQLQSLRIRYCINITDERIRALATGCPQLQFLDISYCCLLYTSPSPRDS